MKRLTLVLFLWLVGEAILKKSPFFPRGMLNSFLRAGFFLSLPTRFAKIRV
jgi:hypothetical protein